MARIAGNNIPENKRVEIALMYLYGIGRTTSNKILQVVGIDPNIRVKDIEKKDIDRLRDEIESKYVVEGDLRHEVKSNIKRLKEIGCYRGIRHQLGLPVRGQRTKTNTRTVRGNVRRTAGSGRRSVEKT